MHPLAGLVDSLLPVRDAAGREILVRVADADDERSDGSLVATLRVLTHDADGLIRDVKEQQVVLVPRDHADHPRLADYLRACLAAVPAIHAVDGDTLMPCDFFVVELLGLPDQDERGFREVLEDPERRGALLRAAAEQERREIYTRVVGPDRVDAMLALRRPRYVLTTEPLEDVEQVESNDEEDHHPDVGSFLGGRPDLPPGFAWPYGGDTLLTFLAQIDLADLEPLDGPHADLLPRSGVLSLFFNMYGDPDPDRGHGVLHYFPDRGELVRTRQPASRYAPPLPMSAFTAERVNDVLPGWEQPHFPLLLDTFDARDPWSAAIDIVRGPAQFDGSWWDDGNPKHQLLGYPTILQSDALAAAAYDERERLGLAHPEFCTREYAEQAAEWCLLLQIDSESDVMLGDDGMVHVVIRREDLRARRFDRARIVFQCH